MLEEDAVIPKMVEVGQQLRDGLDAQARSHGFSLRQTGPVQMPQIMFADDADFSVGYAWTQEMLARGFYLHPWHNMFLCAAMTEGDIEDAIAAAEDAFAALAGKLDEIPPHPLMTAMAAASA